MVERLRTRTNRPYKTEPADDIPLVAQARTSTPPESSPPPPATATEVTTEKPRRVRGSGDKLFPRQLVGLFTEEGYARAERAVREGPRGMSLNGLVREAVEVWLARFEAKDRATLASLTERIAHESELIRGLRRKKRPRDEK